MHKITSDHNLGTFNYLFYRFLYITIHQQKTKTAIKYIHTNIRVHFKTDMYTKIEIIKEKMTRVATYM